MIETKRRKVAVFDVLGVACVLAFLVVVGLDFAELRWRGQEIELDLAPEALSEGFREGTEWHAIYDDERKLGYSRLERRRLPDGYELASYTLLNTMVMGRATTSVVSVTTELGAEFDLRAFTAEVDGDLAQLRARGRVEPGRIVVDVSGGVFGDEPRQIELPAERPTFDFSVRPLLMRDDLEVGQRYSFEHFDPTTLSTQQTSLEYLGRDTVMIMGEPVEAHHLRQELAGQVLDSWVNELGEILREELPGGLTAVRESEAEATWGVERPEGGSR